MKTISYFKKVIEAIPQTQQKAVQDMNIHMHTGNSSSDWMHVYINHNTNTRTLKEIDLPKGELQQLPRLVTVALKMPTSTNLFENATIRKQLPLDSRPKSKQHRNFETQN